MQETADGRFLIVDDDSFVGYCYDDGGRSDAGFKGERAGDCVTRALAIFLGRPYRQVYDYIAKINKSFGNRKSARDGIPEHVMETVFQNCGLVRVQLPKGANPTFTEAYDRYGDHIAFTTKHVVAIVDGYVRDTSDCRYYVWRGRRGELKPEVRQRKSQKVWVHKSRLNS